MRCSLLLIAAALMAQTLPIKRVMLYKNGVGYFEHSGSVEGDQQVAVQFTSSQLNDVLKSLVVLDLGGGRITGVHYGSSAPLERQLIELRLPSGERATLGDFLQSVRGARVEVQQDGVRLTGRVLGLEKKRREAGEMESLSLVTESSEVRSVELSPAISVRLLDVGLQERFARYLDLVSAAREQDARQLRVSTAGTGQRNLFLSYVSEVPVWKATYRLVFPQTAEAKPMLQGWAIVDNTVGEDWEGVELSLVSGAPQSFTQELAAPQFASRAAVEVSRAPNPAPLAHEATLRNIGGRVLDAEGRAVVNARILARDAAGNLVGDTRSDPLGAWALPGVAGPVTVTVNAEGYAESTQRNVQGVQDVRLALGTREVAAVTQSTRTGSGRALGRGQYVAPAMIAGAVGGAPSGLIGGIAGAVGASPPAKPAAKAQPLGDLFEYRLTEPITLRKNQSALVPILQESVEMEKVSFWAASGPADAKPRRGVWLRNTTGNVLDGGSFSVLDAGAFAGEGIFEPIRDGERRFLTYAIDTALQASSRDETTTSAVSRVLVAKGVMTHHRESRQTRTYTFRNEDAAERMIIVEHPYRSGWQLRGPAQPEESTRSFHRFRLRVPAKQTATLIVEEAKPLEASYTVSTLQDDQIAVLVHEKSVPPEVEAALREAIAQRDALETLTQQRSAFEQEKTDIYDDQQRLRENVKSLKGSAAEQALLLRYTRRLNQQEDRLAKLVQEIEKLDAKIAAAQAALEQYVTGLAFDIAL